MKKFFGVIGNPPYQEEMEGTSDKPIYDKFMNESYKVADGVELITPARFLFNAGKTPAAWNRQMLNDEHLKVIHYEPDSSKIFPPPIDIKGGVVITYHDSTKKYEPIEVFSAFEKLREILSKVKNHKDKSLSEIVNTSDAYRFTEILHEEHPEVASCLSKGHENDVVTNVFETVPQLFNQTLPNDGNEYVQIYGRDGGSRSYKYIRADYVTGISNFDHYKVFVPKSNGSGVLGEALSSPLIGEPLVGHTQTFISIGCFDSEDEAQACLKYIKTKFARALLGVLKVTQHNPAKTWKYVPLQDFTSSSDIDWSKSVADIDQQLYKKYGLSEDEIEFIETHVKEMN